MNTGKVIPIAYPDAYVRYSEVGFQKTILGAFGIGTNGFVKGGHALLLLINNETGNVQYFDFGRYITPYGKGRVRSAVTDTELEIPIKAKLNEQGELLNIKEILIWLEARPEKTHGEGRMIASVCDDIDYDKAHDFLLSLQNQGSIPYKTFGNIGSNCSRLVADTLINGTTSKLISKFLRRNSKFTPSPLGNVKYGALGRKMFEIYNGKFTEYKKSVLKENLVNFFASNDLNDTRSTLAERFNNAQLLEGVGASAYFDIEFSDKKYTIIRYTTALKEDFKGVFTVDKQGFDINQAYEFIYDCNCAYCHIKQNDIVYRFDVIKS